MNKLRLTFPILVVVFVALIGDNANAQTGACCIDMVCVGTMDEWECFGLGGDWFEGGDCDAGFDCESAYPCGYYVLGDYNGNGVFNIVDAIAAMSKLQTGSPDAGLMCECPPQSGHFWAVAFDLNDSCTFNLADVILAFRRRIIRPPFEPCHECPPAPF